MGKTEVLERLNVQFVNVNGHELVIMDGEEYDRLIDIVDAAHVQRVLSDPNSRFLKWEDVQKDLLRNRIAEARKERGVMQKELAKKLRVKQSTVSRMEKKDANLTLATLRRVAKALKCPVHELLT